ncbi:BRCT domain [Arabidopsis suecica]|uniref:Pescadillo homolog n=1 Tax=Arabidopsis suecica TaxID=45249 RepID=A0A8T1Z9K6_ARASU|nr:BRCT domain [Arabidopsis suecica]
MPKHYRPAGKKKEGNAARYMTRSQALKHLQVNLNLFRRLCIVKGIFPREPKKKVKGNHHTYYHVKDIAFLMHEPLLEKFREIKTYQKKVKKAKAKKNEELARLLLTRQPTYKLDRLIRERYPTFIDALRDLDDCLTMVHLFAVLPASDRENLEVKRVHNCRRLTHEWQAYISRCHALRKVFVSVKGIYYQAELEGQKITWLTPHAIQQVFTNDVDFGVLLTFLEFYETLLAFINFKLYHSLNVKYPPILDSRLEALAADLYALSRYIDASSRGMAVEPKVDASSSSQSNDREESELRLAQLQHQLPSSEPGALMHLVADNNKEVEEDEETRVCKSLFKDLKFFLSREVPRESLLFVLPAFGGMVSWEGEGAPFKEDDESITHHIIDKPSAGHVYLSRVYVQPQWIYDCVNARIILPTEKYLVGRIPPPHLSPFVDNEAEGYVPDYAETIKRLQAAARNEVLPLPGVGKEDLEDPQNLLYAGVMSRAEEAEAAKNKKKMAAQEKQYHEELKMEITASKDVVAPMVTEDEESVPDAMQIAQENADMSTVLMSRKKRKLYEAMKIGQKKKKASVELIEQRKKKLNDAQS